MHNAKSLALIVIIALTFGGLAYAKGKGKSKDEHSHEGKESNHNLRDVMQYLGAAQGQIQTGLLTNNRLLIAEGAKAIAHHPNPKGGIAPYIKKPTKGLKETIGAMDKLVHGNAVEIYKKSQSASMLELQTLNAKMMTGCINCHNVFRD